MQPDLPPAALAALRSRSVDVSALREQGRSGRGAVIRVWWAGTAAVVVARDKRGCRVNQSEVAGRHWAAGVGVGVPEIWAHADDGAWLVGEWLSAEAPTGTEYVRAALTGADLIMGAELPRGSSVSVQSWRGSRRGRALRALRVMAAGLDPREFVGARNEATVLPADFPAHGDFYFRNVLNVSTGIRVVDWEFAGPAPAFTDHLRFWSTLKAEEDRLTALELILEGRSRVERAHIGTLGRWLAFRLFAENVSAPRRLQNPADRAHATAGLDRGRELFEMTRR